MTLREARRVVRSNTLAGDAPESLRWSRAFCLFLWAIMAGEFLSMVTAVDRVFDTDPPDGVWRRYYVYGLLRTTSSVLIALGALYYSRALARLRRSNVPPNAHAE